MSKIIRYFRDCFRTLVTRLCQGDYRPQDHFFGAMPSLRKSWE